jgi:hypothetical protein
MGPSTTLRMIVTLDDATGEHTSMFFVEEEGTLSSLHGLGQTIAAKGLFCSFYTDRGSHYFLPPRRRGSTEAIQLRACPREGGGRAGTGAVGHRAHCRVFAAGARALRAGVCHPP